MKNSPLFPILKFVFVLFLCFGTQIAFADSTTAPSSSLTHLAQTKKPDDSDTSSTLVVHKPTTDPSWGKVIQYQEEKAVSPVDKTTETLHKFLFQDSNGVVRTAIYHEGESGTGYWEVQVWDQP